MAFVSLALCPPFQTLHSRFWLCLQNSERLPSLHGSPSCSVIQKCLQEESQSNCGAHLYFPFSWGSPCTACEWWGKTVFSYIISSLIVVCDRNQFQYQLQFHSQKQKSLLFLIKKKQSKTHTHMVSSFLDAAVLGCDDGCVSQVRELRKAGLQTKLIWQEWQGLPWWSSDKEPACQCGGHGFNRWSRKIPHCRATNPGHSSYWVHALEPMLHSKQATAMRRLCSAMKSSPCPLQLGKAWAQQRRHSTAKNKLKNNIY